MLKRLAILLILTLFAAAVSVIAADDVQIKATVDKDRISQYDYVQLNVEVSGSGRGLGNPQLPKMDDFEVIGTSQQTRINIVNFKTERQQVFSYQLLPINTGRLTIPPVSVRAGNKTYKTQPIKVYVIPDADPVASANSDQSIQPERELSIDPAKTDTFIEAVIEPMQAFLGQKVIVTYYLTTRATLTNLELQKLPVLEGFWSEILESPSNLAWAEVDIAGYRYKRALVRRYVLFPITTGDLAIDPLVLRIAKRTASRHSRNDPFAMFLGATKAETIASLQRTLAVKPLPEEGKSDKFDGAVGNFNIKVTTDATTVKAGEALAYKVKITGDGNAKSIKEPVLNLPTVFKEYKPKITEKTTPMQSDIRVEKEFAYILVPTQTETEKRLVTIPPAELHYFDPATGTYRQSQSNSVEVTILPGEVQQAHTRSVLTKEHVLLEEQDIRHIKPDSNALPVEGRHPLQRTWVKIVLAIYPLIILAVFLIGRFREKRLQDVSGARLRMAGGKAKKRLSKAKKLLDSGEARAFYGELDRAIAKYVADKLGLSAAGLNRAEIVRLLTERGAGKDLIEQIDTLLEHCDLYRFSMASPDPDDMNASFNSAGKIINNLEKSKVLK